MPELIAKDSIDIAAPPARVWTVLTEPAETRKYMFDCEAVSDWKAGSKLDWRGAKDGVVYVTGTVVAIKPGRRLQYTTREPKHDESYDATVIYELEPHQGGTRLNVSQDFNGATDGQARYEHTKEGWKSVLEQIKTVAEQPA